MLAEIETYLTKPIALLQIDKNDYIETVELHNDRPDKWKAVMDEIESAESWMRKKQKKGK